MAMNIPNAHEIATAVIDEMKSSGHALWIDPETHANQHEFIAEMIQERKEKQARRKRLEEKIAGSLILSAMLTLIGFIGAGFIQWIKTNS